MHDIPFAGVRVMCPRHRGCNSYWSGTVVVSLGPPLDAEVVAVQLDGGPIVFRKWSQCAVINW